MSDIISVIEHIKELSLIVDNLADKINESSKQIRGLSKQLDTLTNKVDILENITTRMDGHIDLVENVYENIRHPLSSVISRFSFQPLQLTDIST